MKSPGHLFKSPNKSIQGAIAILCVGSLSLDNSPALAQQPQPAQAQTMTTAAPAAEQPAAIPSDQLDSLVAPIALYPDPLLAQTLAAATYPLEIIQLQQWLLKNPNLKDKALEDALVKQPWDASIQAMAAFPDVVKRLADDVQWTTDLGNAFLAQQADVMAAVQRMRAKAQGTGNLKTGAQQVVETQTVESGQQVIVIKQANPTVVYVPSYNPTVVYGAPVYPYPPIYYPPPGYYAAGAALAFGAGVALGAAWGGGWGYGCGWGHGDVNVNVNNKYVNNYNKNVNRTVNNANINNSNWQHNPQHRGGAPYSNKATATKYSGANATAGTVQGSRGGAAAGVSTKNGNTAVGKTASGNVYGVHNGNVYSGSGNAAKSGGGAANAGAGGAGAGSRPSTQPAGGGGDKIGGRSTSGGSGGGAFGGASSGMNKGAAQASSNRGGQSMGGGGGGGRGGGGGGHGGGGGRGGGGGGGRRR